MKNVNKIPNNRAIKTSLKVNMTELPKETEYLCWGSSDPLSLLPDRDLHKMETDFFEQIRKTLNGDQHSKPIHY